MNRIMTKDQLVETLGIDISTISGQNQFSKWFKEYPFNRKPISKNIFGKMLVGKPVIAFFWE